MTGVPVRGVSSEACMSDDGALLTLVRTAVVKHRAKQPARFIVLVSGDSSPLFPRLAFRMICGSLPPKVMMSMVDA